VFDATGVPVAALNVSGPESAFHGVGRRERIGGTVQEAAEDISRRLGWHGPSLRVAALERVA
jgi:DNA-binding IclR family transcriptional regulator